MLEPSSWPRHIGLKMGRRAFISLSFPAKDVFLIVGFVNTGDCVVGERKFPVGEYGYK